MRRDCSERNSKRPRKDEYSLIVLRGKEIGGLSFEI